MDKKNEIQLFEARQVRSVWAEKAEKMWFSVVDVVAVLTDQDDVLTARKYWNKLKQRLKEEGNETVTNCHQLKMLAFDGKMRLTDVADTEQILRLVQSIPSKNAEPFKLWLAQVGRERIDEASDPEKSIDRKQGANAAKVARKQIEKDSGKPAISRLNAKKMRELG
jgi:hypothetical protein